jgi:3-oxoacyl-[acyl-carrier protein] reductase
MKTGRVVVITGAAGGMGKLFVERFLTSADAVIASDTGNDGLTKLAKELGSDRLLTGVADISDEASTGGLADFFSQG